MISREHKCRQRNSRPSRPLERAGWPNDGTRKRLSDVLNKAQYPSDVIALVVLWRLRYKLSLAGSG